MERAKAKAKAKVGLVKELPVKTDQVKLGDPLSDRVKEPPVKSDQTGPLSLVKELGDHQAWSRNRHQSRLACSERKRHQSSLTRLAL